MGPVSLWSIKTSSNEWPSTTPPRQRLGVSDLDLARTLMVFHTTHCSFHCADALLRLGILLGRLWSRHPILSLGPAEAQKHKTPERVFYGTFCACPLVVEHLMTDTSLLWRISYKLSGQVRCATPGKQYSCPGQDTLRVTQVRSQLGRNRLSLLDEESSTLLILF